MDSPATARSGSRPGVLGSALAALLLLGPTAASAEDAQAWPPPVDALVSADGCLPAPACDLDADAEGPALRTGEWVRVIETRTSTCSRAVQAFDPRTREGNRASEPSVFRIEGSCVLGDDGAVVGAVRDGILASCEATEQALGVIAYEAGVIDLRKGRGYGRAPLTGLPWLLTGQSACEIEVGLLLQPASEPSAGPAVSAPRP